MMYNRTLNTKNLHFRIFSTKELLMALSKDVFKLKKAKIFMINNLVFLGVLQKYQNMAKGLNFFLVTKPKC